MDIIIENCLFLGNYKFAPVLEDLKKFGVTNILVKKINIFEKKGILR